MWHSRTFPNQRLSFPEIMEGEVKKKKILKMFAFVHAELCRGGEQKIWKSCSVLNDVQGGEMDAKMIYCHLQRGSALATIYLICHLFSRRCGIFLGRGHVIDLALRLCVVYVRSTLGIRVLRPLRRHLTETAQADCPSFFHLFDKSHQKPWFLDAPERLSEVIIPGCCVLPMIYFFLRQCAQSKKLRQVSQISLCSTAVFGVDGGDLQYT